MGQENSQISNQLQFKQKNCMFGKLSMMPQLQVSSFELGRLPIKHEKARVKAREEEMCVRSWKEGGGWRQWNALQDTKKDPSIQQSQEAMHPRLWLTNEHVNIACCSSKPSNYSKDTIESAIARVSNLDGCLMALAKAIDSKQELQKSFSEVEPELRDAHKLQSIERIQSAGTVGFGEIAIPTPWSIRMPTSSREKWHVMS